MAETDDSRRVVAAVWDAAVDAAPSILDGRLERWDGLTEHQRMAVTGALSSTVRNIVVAARTCAIHNDERAP